MKNAAITFTYKGFQHNAYSIGTGFIPDIKDVLSVHAMVLTSDGKIVAVNVRSRGVDLIGGHIEPFESNTLETLRREINEEAQLTVKHPVIADVLEIESELKESKSRKYMIIYIAQVDELNDFISNDEISDRLILSIDQFEDRYFGKAPFYINSLYDYAIKKF